MNQHTLKKYFAGNILYAWDIKIVYSYPRDSTIQGDAVQLSAVIVKTGKRPLRRAGILKLHKSSNI